MDLYIAELVDVEIAQRYFEKKQRKLNLLFSFYYEKTHVEDTIQKFAPYTNKVILDSGGFTLFKKPDETEGHKNQYLNFVKNSKEFIENTFEYVFSLDCSDDPSNFGQNMKIYAELKEISDKIIPVIHDISPSTIEIDAYAKTSPQYMSIGKCKDKFRDNLLQLAAGKIRKTCKCHLLGVTNPYYLINCHADFCDSKSWIDYSSANRVCYFDCDPITSFDPDIKYNLANFELIYFPDTIGDEDKDKVVPINKFHKRDKFFKEMEEELGITEDEFFTPLKQKAIQIANIYYMNKMGKYVDSVLKGKYQYLKSNGATLYFNPY